MTSPEEPHDKKPSLLSRWFKKGDATPPSSQEEPSPPSFWQRLKQGLSRSSSRMSQGIVDIFTKRKITKDVLDALEDVLLQADLGLPTAERLCAAIAKGRYDKEITPQEVREILAKEIEEILNPVAHPLPAPHISPTVYLMVGVNGSGKTTTIGKLAAQYTQKGRKVMIAAGDTFRAAAVEQLQIWGLRAKAEVITRPEGSDASGLIFEAFKRAQEEKAEALFIDTAGRLQNRKELMAELEKIIRVIQKIDPTAPHHVLLVLDATVGQNALSQVEIFSHMAQVTGLVMTKLDGTARGGILVALAQKFSLPIHLIGVGEHIEDLEAFEPAAFAKALLDVS